MKKHLLSILFLNLLGCSLIQEPVENRKAIQQAVFEGMSKADMLKRLGEPYKIDHYSKHEEVVYYETDALAATFCVQYTAIRLLDNKVKDWGQQVCKSPVQESRIEPDKIDGHLRD